MKLGSKPTTSSSSRTRERRERREPTPCTISGSATMSPTVIRGSSDEYGSWNTICMSRRSFRTSPRGISVSSLPMNRTDPPVGLISWSTQ